MKVLDIIKSFNEKKIEDGVLEFRIYTPMERGGKYLFFNESRNPYETFIDSIKDSEIMNLDVEYEDVEVNIQFHGLNYISVEIDILSD